MSTKLPKEKELFFMQELEDICKNSRILESHKYMQHGDTSVFRHSVSVAYYSYYLALKLHAPVNETSLIRGALLHDYFLYDWHQKDSSHRLHGFRHPKTALGNAQRDYHLNWKEKNIIARHMFPLIPVPPQCREAWIVCLADKWCALRETVAGRLPRKDDANDLSEGSSDGSSKDSSEKRRG